ncbi:MAG: hypothetical protein PQ612_03295 [Rickettsiales bacterium]|nr:hypothetical protein [Pseudomonadota bacterium]MDA0965862.1 hypothetical protein [Pseudomonadota bacterium]MDG4542668.1 hypothetical protein [Rickettsiales bacterium]MDG4545172.1 hypothetical protein [Rickettsiales bacterium]MDG4547295.1 hypothetical protein [Rickettsiales bacterium]
MKYIISFIVLFAVGIAGFMLVGRDNNEVGSKSDADNQDARVDGDTQVNAADGKSVFVHEMDQNINEFIGDQRVVPIKPFRDFNAHRLYDKPFFEISGPFAIYAENGGRVASGTGAFYDNVKLTVYTLRWHDRLETENIVPIPTPFIAYVASGDGKRISTNTKDYDKVALEPEEVKYPESSGLNVAGKIRLKDGARFDSVGAIKGILQAKLPQKIIQYNFFSLRDFGMNYKIGDSTIIKIQEGELPVKTDENSNTNYKGYVVKILTLNQMPFTIDFKNDRGRNITGNLMASSSENLPDGRKLYTYNYAVGAAVGGAKVSVPFSYKNESYPFMMKRIKTSNPYSKQEMSDEEMAYQSYLSRAKSGDAESQYRVAFMLNKGMGVQKNLQAARAWLEKAAAQGHEKALQILGGGQKSEPQPLEEQPTQLQE